MLGDASSIAIVTTVIAAATSLIVALVGMVAGVRSQRRASETAGQLEELRTTLAEERAERDARRDYEYEARKHLYQVCGPLIFQLTERSEDALYRIYSLARTSREGHLSKDG